MTPLAKNNLAAPDIRLGDRGSLRLRLKGVVTNKTSIMKEEKRVEEYVVH